MIRRSPEEKREIIHLVENSDISIRKTLKELEIARSTFYRWYRDYLEEGKDSLIDKRPQPRQFWNRIPDTVRQQVVDNLTPKEYIQTNYPQCWPQVSHMY
jgi:putative transposase